MTPPILKSADMQDLLDRIDPELVSKGALHVLAFDAIRERSGRRWELRRETVWEVVEREFEKAFSSTDHLVRLDDVNFLVLQPSQTRHAAQGAALRLLREVLTFFLGSAARADVKLSQVTSIGPDGIECTSVLVSEAEFAALSAAPAEPASERPAPRDTAQAPAEPEARSVASWVDTGRESAARVVPGDRNYEVLSLLEPMWDVRNRAVASHRLRPLVFERTAEEGLMVADLRRASVKDLIRLDLVALTEAQSVMHREADKRRFALHVPIHYATLTTSAGRKAVLWALEQMQPHAASSVVVCITGLEPGAPQSRLVEATSTLKGRCRAVVAQAPNLKASVEQWRDAQLSGISLDFGDPTTEEARRDLGELSRFAARAQTAAPRLIGYSINDRPTMLLAWAAGFTHLSGELIFDRLKEPLTPVRFEPYDLYGERKIG